MHVLTYPRPVTGLEAKFSLEYSLAAGVLDGGYSLWSFGDEAVQRPAIQALLGNIVASEDPRCAGNDPLLKTRSSGSRGFVEVEVELTDGRSETLRVDQAPGHPARELGWDELHTKFLDCAAHADIAKDKAERAFVSLTKFEQCSDVNDVVALLTHG
jgi:2-methylcitrate dehydratase PrpD